MFPAMGGSDCRGRVRRRKEVAPRDKHEMNAFDILLGSRKIKIQFSLKRDAMELQSRCACMFQRMI